jgi:hypothetical protein
MSEEIEKNEGGNHHNHNEFFSKPVRAGKRTYFFDVKATRGNDHYLTITESKKRFGADGKFFYEKHKIFLYKEDFEKFSEGLAEAVAYIKANAPAVSEHSHENNSTENSAHSHTHSHSSEVNFEDLGS